MSETEGTGGKTRAILLLPLGLAVLMVPVGAAAQAPVTPPEPPSFTAAEASAQLDQAVTALTSPNPVAANPTDELRHLAAAVPYLDGRERRQARAILARPPADDGGHEPFGAEWPASAAQETLGTSNFVVHWPEVPGCNAPAQGCDEPDLEDSEGGGNGVPDYIDQVAGAVEQSFDVENTELGWPKPKPDGNRGGNGKVDVYVADICDETGGGACVFGYANPDDPSAQCRRPPFRCFAYLVLDNDYAGVDGSDPDSIGDEFDYDDPGVPLRVTTAHEYNHILQFRLDAMQDGWMFESTAVWSEEQVFPDDDDWLFYLDAWKRQSHEPITKFNAGGGLRVYGSAVWNHWLELGAGYGPDVVLDSWEQSRNSERKDFAVAAYDLGIKENGGRGFSHEFGRFATATAEWRVLDGNFPGVDANDPDEGEFPDVRRRGTLRRGRPAKRFRLDHTAYRLLRVKPGPANLVKLKVRTPRRRRTAIALVGRDGNPLTGTITTKLSHNRRGGRDSVRLKNAQDFERITAVVVNADGRFRRGEYVSNNGRFRARLR